MRLSVPSYIMKGTYLENIRYISDIPEVESVELLVFMYDEETHLLLEEELPEIGKFTDRLGFTLHMPDHCKEEHHAIIDLTRDIVSTYVLHPPTEEPERFLAILSRWIDKYGEIFVIENLIVREFELLLDAEPRAGVCLDTGHLLLRGGNPLEFTRTYGSRIKEIHLHGILDGCDHNVFDEKEEWFQELLPFLRSFTGICNIELFAEVQVRQVLKKLSALSLL